MSPFWKTVLCLTLFAAWRSQVEFRSMTSRRPLDCAQRCPCSGESYLDHHHHDPYAYSHAQAPNAMLATARRFAEAFPAGGDSVLGGDGKASSQLRLAREVGVRAAAGRGSNFIVSPLSIHAALALVAAGARGETRQELLGFLGSASIDELHDAAWSGLVGKLNGLTQTSFACGVWVDRGHELQAEFMAAAASRYAATAESVDFSSEAEKARQRVNGFVEDATNGLVRDVLPPGSVDSTTVVVLANALYFKGTWAQPFDQSATITAPFHTPDGSVVRVPFMTTGRFDFQRQIAVYPGFRALKLPYKIDDGDHAPPQAPFYMLILLPDGDSLADLYDEAVATPEFIRRHTPAYEVPVGRFMVPKFKFSFEFEASEDMQKLGVTRAFVGGDFSAMVRGGDGLLISGVHHKATIEVDELGTVAAAATAVVMLQSASARPPVDFVADRPFLFAIVEEKTSAVLFLGHVVNPASR
ncbi:putative serpin-Z12 [Lolium rigidum]|uniref:putative serpin-Z12 n=1 Tax=Lolium rigidum TaxID=89674 RepID=UPI001F5CE515|nr:putative serpin-Z12 [Lolium rigidum]